MTERNSARFSYKDQFMLTYPEGRLPMEIGSPLSGSRLTCLNANENSFGFDVKIDILIKIHQRHHLPSPASIIDANVIDELDAQETKNSNIRNFEDNSSGCDSAEHGVNKPLVEYSSICFRQSTVKESPTSYGSFLQSGFSKQIPSRKDSENRGWAITIPEQARFIGRPSIWRSSQSPPTKKFPPGQCFGQLKRFPETGKFQPSVLLSK